VTLRTALRTSTGSIALAVAVLGGAVLAGALVGPSGLTLGGVLRELASAVPGIDLDSGMSTIQQGILWQIRLPRVVLGVLVGATLAAAGAAYQGVFANPLADPYLLGVSSGAGLGATMAIVAGGAVGGFGVPPMAFAGALLGVAATYLIGTSVGAQAGPVAVVLAGVAVAALCGAIQNFIQQQYDESLAAVYNWTMGRLSTDGWHDVWVALPYVVLCCAVVWLFRRSLDVMLLGDVEAASLGVHPTRVRLALVLAATLGTAAVVSVSGLIGFVGIVVPHTVRLLFGGAHHRLLPLAMLYGAAFLVLADIGARQLMSPAEVPVGVITAMVGAPFFLVVLRRFKAGG